MARKRRKTGEEKGADIGMVLTVSLFLILLTFFILLNSIAVLDQEKVRLSIGSLIGAFGSLTGGISPFKSGDNIVPPTTPMVENEVNLGDLLGMMEDVTIPGDIKISNLKGSNRILIKRDAFFFPGTLEFRPESGRLFEILGEHVREGDFPIEITCHPGTDNIDQGSVLQAALTSVKIHSRLVDGEGIDPLRVTSYGNAADFIEDDGGVIDTESDDFIEIRIHYNLPEYSKRIIAKKPSGRIRYKKFTFRIF